MDRDLDALLGFAPDIDAPIPYMQRTRDYYAAIGYTTPYRWAHYVEAPFTPLSKPLARSRVTVITTAAPYRPDKGDQGSGAAYNGGAKFYKVYSGDTSQQHDLRISHIGYDRVHTSAEDSGTWFPLPALLHLRDQGRIGAVTPRFHGIATVVMGCAKDIVEHAAVPRLLFSDFPLGNSAGRPHDPASQALTLELALHVLESAPGPRTTMQSPLRWSEDASWKLDYLNLDRIPPEELARRRREFAEQKAVARDIRTGKAA